MRRKIKKIDCMEYLSVQVPLEKVNMFDDKQSRYIYDYVRKSGYVIVEKIRYNGFLQRDVNQQWMQIDGVVVVNMVVVFSSMADAYYKVGLVVETGSIVVTVDEGRLEMLIKEVA